VFVSKEKLCALMSKGGLFIFTFDGKSKQVDWVKDSKIDHIFPASMGKILVKCGDVVYLYDISARKILAE